MIATEQLCYFLEHDCHVQAIRAIGVYDGDSEQSFIVHTNQSSVLCRIKLHAVVDLGQECVLIRYNRKHKIDLHFANATTEKIGEQFNSGNAAPKGAHCYTILNNIYYTVR
jgi:hypothetical protein